MRHENQIMESAPVARGWPAVCIDGSGVRAADCESIDNLGDWFSCVGSDIEDWF